jgi:Nucleotide-binding protein implicated in inhibition of septum formation
LKKVREGLIIASDTLVSLDGCPLGKPADRDDAYHMLRSLSGRAHEVYTGVCVLDAQSGRCLVREDCTFVVFKPLTDAQIFSYIDSGEPMDRAGAYAIQGGAAPFVERIDGAFDNVVGFPTALVAEMLRAFGVE